MVIVLAVSSFIIFGTLLIVFMIQWLVHRDMTIDESQCYDYGGYMSFIEQFDKIEQNHAKVDYQGSAIWGYNNDRQWPITIISSWGEITFEHKGMILYPISFLLVNLYLYKYFKKLSNKRKVGLWQ